MINCAVYPRKSKADENSESMAMQVDSCKEYLDRTMKEPYSVTIYDADYGITGHSVKKRLDYQRMLNDVRSGKINCVVVYKYDRLSRNMYDFINFYHELEEYGCSLISVTQRIDTSHPAGKQMMYQFAGWAEYEWELNSQRRKDSNYYMTKIGRNFHPKHRLPLGYMPGIVDGMKKVVKDPSEEQMVIDVINDYLTYETIHHATSYINDKYGKTYTVTVIKNILFGDMMRGKYKDNDHYCEPYIDAETAIRIDSIRKKYIRHYADDNFCYLLTGLIICPECGSKLTSKRATKNQATRTVYYKCINHEKNCYCKFYKSVNEKYTEEFIINSINDTLQSHRIKIEPSKTESKTIDTLPLKKQLERLTNAFIKGRMEESKYDFEYEKIQRKIREAEEQNMKKEPVHLAEKLSMDWLTTYNQLTRTNKRAFWRQTIKEIHLNSDGSVKEIIFL